MKVAFDYDGTLADTNRLLLDLLNFKNDTQFQSTQVTRYDWFHKGGRDKDFWRLYDLFDTTYLRRAIPPVDPLACPLAKWLERRGHAVDIVTANDPKCEPSIQSWLFGHGLDLEVKALGRVTSAEKVKLDYDLYIDDAPGMVRSVDEANRSLLRKAMRRSGKRLLLVDQPWNRVDPDGYVVRKPEFVRRLTDWTLSFGMLKAWGF